MVYAPHGSLSGIKRHDYLPFGEELFAGVGSRTTAQGYNGADGNRRKWAQLERDDETGLDYAQARYYSSTQGRFTSVDPLLASAGIVNPQSWNRYAYVLNNPLNLIDPTGLLWYYNTQQASASGVYEPVWYDKKPGDGWALWVTHANYNYFVSDGANSHYTTLNPYANESQQFTSEQEAGEQLNAWNENGLFHEAFDPIADQTAPVGTSMEIMFAADNFLIGGVTTLGTVGTASLGLEVGTEAATTASSAASVAEVDATIARGLSDSSTRGVTKELIRHQNKLIEYAENPLSQDNIGHLRSATTMERYQNVTAGRAKGLVHSILEYWKQIGGRRP